MKPTCPFCLKEYEVAGDDYVKHVAVCNENKKRIEAEAAQKKLVAVKESRKKELDAAREAYQKLDEAFVKDYPDEPVQRYLAPGWKFYINGEKAPEYAVWDALKSNGFWPFGIL